MTPEERAEKILLLCQLPTNDSAYSDPRNGLPRHLKDYIAAEIREAVEGALDADHKNALDVSGFVQKAKAEAYEDAAKIAENEKDPLMDDYCGDRIAEKIRALVALARGGK